MRLSDERRMEKRSGWLDRSVILSVEGARAGALAVQQKAAGIQTPQKPGILAKTAIPVGGSHSRVPEDPKGIAVSRPRRASKSRSFFYK